MNNHLSGVNAEPRKDQSKENRTMTTVILLAYVAVIVISYKGAVFVLNKTGLL